MQKYLAIHCAVIRPVKKLEDRRFRGGQSDSPILGRVLQHPLGWTEFVRADKEKSVFTAFEEPQLGSHTSEQLIHPKRLHNVIVSASLKSTNHIRLTIWAGEYDNWKLPPLSPHSATEVTPIAIRHAYVEYHGVDGSAFVANNLVGSIEFRCRRDREIVIVGKPFG
jgi:hypothetical protein